MSKRFFKLCRNYPTRAWYLAVPEKGPFTSDDDLCAYFRGERTPVTPPVLELRGAQPIDIAVGLGYPFVNTRTLEVFKQNKISGWDTYPITLISKKPIDTQFFGLVVRGRCGPAVHLGNYNNTFDVNNWDGTDIFTYKHGGATLATENVVEIISREKLRCSPSEQLTVIGVDTHRQ